MSRSGQARVSCRIAVKVTPNARANELRGFSGGVLLVRLNAPPVDGKANAALIRFVAKHLGIPRSAVALAHGASGRNKLLEIAGLSRDEAVARLLH